MKKIMCLILMMCAGVSLFAQAGGGHLTEEKRKEFEAQKVAFFTQEMKLTPEEATKFWPLYNEMQQKIHECRDRVRKLGKNKTCELTEVEARQKMDAIIEAESKECKIRGEYYRRISEATSAKKLLLMFEAERNFQKQLWKKLGKNPAPK